MWHHVEHFGKVQYESVSLLICADSQGPVIDYMTELHYAAVISSKSVLVVRENIMCIHVPHEI